MSGIQFPHRWSSTTISQANNMTLRQTEILYEYNRAFEDEPKNLECAYKLFREFNKHGMYISVIRLYYKNDLGSRDPNKHFFEQMRSQFEYAKDHIE